MKSVLISIQPKWCKLIASGEKFVEIRKTRPKIELPFKCYIYETKGKLQRCSSIGYEYEGKGKIIGEFICKSIFSITITYSDPDDERALREFPHTGLNQKEIMNYLGNGKKGWGWLICDLVIYGKPKELSEFRKYISFLDGESISELEESGFSNIRMKRPPQSWCYVEHKTVKGGVE